MSTPPKTTTTAAHSGYRYGVAALEFDGKDIGLISAEGLDWGGDEATTVAVYAAQRRGAPVIELDDQPASNELSGYLIELKADNIKNLLGGEVNAGKWSAPAVVPTKIGKFKVTTMDGTVISVGRAKLTASIKGKLAHNELLRLPFKLTILDDGTDSPYNFDTGQPGA